MLDEQGKQTVDDNVQDLLVDAHVHLPEEEASTDQLDNQPPAMCMLLVDLKEWHNPGKTQQSDSLALTFVTVTRVSRCNKGRNNKSETLKVGQRWKKKAPVWHASQSLSDGLSVHARKHFSLISSLLQNAGCYRNAQSWAYLL